MPACAARSAMGRTQASAASARVAAPLPGASGGECCGGGIVPAGRDRHEARRRVRVGARPHLPHPHAMPRLGLAHGPILGAVRATRKAHFGVSGPNSHKILWMSAR